MFRSGLLYLLAVMAKTTMVSVCFASGNLVQLVKTFTFIELSSANMQAITNLAICVNLALIIMVSVLAPFT